jgi:hypothetical protein
MKVATLIPPRIIETAKYEPAKEEGLLCYCMLNIYIGKGKVLLHWLYTIGLRDRAGPSGRAV